MGRVVGKAGMYAGRHRVLLVGQGVEGRLGRQNIFLRVIEGRQTQREQGRKQEQEVRGWVVAWHGIRKQGIRPGNKGRQEAAQRRKEEGRWNGVRQYRHEASAVQVK